MWLQVQAAVHTYTLSLELAMDTAGQTYEGERSAAVAS